MQTETPYRCHLQLAKPLKISQKVYSREAELRKKARFWAAAKSAVAFVKKAALRKLWEEEKFLRPTDSASERHTAHNQHHTYWPVAECPWE